MTGARPLILGHRGAARDHPENSIWAFEAAAAAGADGVELDVRRTSDGALAVIHDARLADGRAVVATPARELPATVPLLDAALAACGDLLVNVEIKNWPSDPDFDPTHEIADAVADAVAGRPNVLVSCFLLPTVARFHAVAPGTPTAWLLSVVADPAAAVADAVAAGCAALHPHETAVDARLVALAHDAGLAVNTWTVDDPVRLLELAELGVDAVVCDDPEAALAVLQGSTSRSTSGSWRNSSDSTSPR
jgi:glycerophosphoryl diester phosphodiesterase